MFLCPFSENPLQLTSGRGNDDEDRFTVEFYNTPGILMAGVGLWFINVIIPVIAGNILLLMLKFAKAN